MVVPGPRDLASSKAARRFWVSNPASGSTTITSQFGEAFFRSTFENSSAGSGSDLLQEINNPTQVTKNANFNTVFMMNGLRFIIEKTTFNSDRSYGNGKGSA
jgi:hypothetical protein